MERERWAELMACVKRVDRAWPEAPRVTHRTAVIVEVYLFAALNDRPVSWACVKQNWRGWKRPKDLPDQSTMSRRVRGEAFGRFLEAMGRAFNRGGPTPLLRKVDGKSLEVAMHSTDRQAKIGRAAGRTGRGYKLHAICSDLPMPEAFVVTPLNVCEKKMARRMLRRLRGDAGGYLLADALYDCSQTHDAAAAAGHQMLCPRLRPGTGLGHRRHAEARRRAIELPEPEPLASDFGQQLYRRRTDIERDFAHLTSFGGGLACLPPWVRRPWRVRTWVHAKLLINAARILLRRRGDGERGA